MFPYITKLQNRFVTFYLAAIFLPITLLSGILYYYQDVQRNAKALNDKKDSLVVEQNYLENQLDNAHNYCTQLTSNYELSRLLKGYYTTEREVVYAYNSQLYSLISTISLYDQNLSNIIIYTNNMISCEILKGFESLDEFKNTYNRESYEVIYNKLLAGYWEAHSIDDDLQFSYYTGVLSPPMTQFSGIIRLNYNSRIFDEYADSNPDSAIYIYLGESLVYSRNDSDSAASCLQLYEPALLTGAETPVIIQDSRQNFTLSSISLCNDTFRVVRITPDGSSLISYYPLLLSMVISILILLSSSILIFILIFQPFRNIVKLSEHMNNQNDHTMKPYNGKLSKDEIGDLIISFNQMTQRINELSASLLNKEMQLKNAQIEALHAQLNPHFFYGTLESIRMIAEANHQELISEIAYSFGNLMRYSLSREYLLSVNKEIEMTKQYISIQEKRLVNRFHVEWVIDELEDNWRCPKFILFSMVENVFSHNVSKCRNFIHIKVDIRKYGDDLSITVQNSGPGITAKRLEEIQYFLHHPKERAVMVSENNGRSIFNISDRLKLFYGDDYHVTVESMENGITTCNVRIHKNFINF